MKTSPRLVAVSAVWVLASVGHVIAALPVWIWILGSSALFVLAAADLAAAMLGPLPSVSRRCDGVLALGVPTDVELVLGGVRRKLRLEIHDHHPPALRAEGLPLALRLSPGEDITVSYRATPVERGRFLFGPAALWVGSPLGFWRRRGRGAEQDPVRVYPNFQSLVRYSLMAQDNRVGQIGIHRYPRRGAGLEFQQLRDYRFGDTPRQIDWKATSRRLRLISCEYQDEQNQRIVLVLDCGRRMRARDGALSHFDHALNAVLLLAHIAVRQGDAVGLSTFGGPQRSLAPRKGVGVVNHLLNATYDIQPTVYAADLAQALEDCSRGVRKRSFIVLVSNIGDEEPDDLVEAVRSLRRRHLVLLAGLHEDVIDRALETEVKDLDGALRVAAAHDLAERRAARLKRLRAEGVLCVDSTPAMLAAALANTYMEVKAARLL